MQSEINKKQHVTVPQEIYDKGCIHTAEQGVKSAEKIGYPIMIKASEGGGGKGIRRCESSEDFPNLFRQVSQNNVLVDFNLWVLVLVSGIKLSIFIY